MAAAPDWKQLVAFVAVMLPFVIVVILGVLYGS